MKCKISKKGYIPPQTCVGNLNKAISDYVEGKLDTATRKRVEAHIKKYARCRACVTSFKKTVKILKKQPKTKVPSQIHNTLRKKLLALVAKKSK
ncbi:anti-sigma factor family protein [Elusimicrobiota bacterium]